MRRRAFLGILGGAAGWPVIARAQQSGAMRRVGVLFGQERSGSTIFDRHNSAPVRLEELGWREGQNIQIEDRWSAGDNNRLQNYAAELAQLNPDVIVCEGTPVVAALQQATRTTPIVFVNANNPIGSGFVASIARPCDGKIACKPVAEAHGLEFTPAEAFID